MSVVRIPKTDKGPESGGGMDRVVASKGLSTRVKIGLAAVAAVLLAAVFYWFAPTANSQTEPPLFLYFERG